MATTGLFDDVKSTGNNAVMVPGPGQTGGYPGIGPSQMDPRVQWILKQVTRSEPGRNKWAEQARQAYRFESGKQLSEEDERVLRSQSRPTNCFNSAQKYIRYVSGVERDSFVALLFNAINMDNEQAQNYGERVGKLFDWCMRLSDGPAERSRAFFDLLVTGMGWTGTAIGRSRDPRGLVTYERISPLEMFWQESAKTNLGGIKEGCTRWRARECHVEKEDIYAMFDTPHAAAIIDQTDDNAAPLTWPSADNVPYVIPYIQPYPLDRLGGKKGDKKDKARLMEFQWWDNEPGYLFEDPLDGTEQWLKDAEFHEYQNILEEKFAGTKPIEEYDHQQGRKWQRAFLLARRVLLEEPSDLPGKRFTFNPMCCHWDEHDRIWYGFMRVLIDPQRYANKFFNQMLEIYGRQAKGGNLYEIDAFDDDAQMRAFLDEYPIPGSNNALASGGLAKIKEKQLPRADASTMGIMQFCVDSMDTVTGLSEQSLGLGAATQAGVTMARKQRAGMVLLSPEFDAESQFRREEGYIVVEHLKLLGDKRLVRIGAGPGAEIVPLDAAPFEMEYDIELDELERDPSVRKYLADLLLGPFGQTLLRMNKFLPEFMQAFAGVYIPQQWVTKIKQMWVEQQKQIQQAQAAGLPVPGGRGPAKPLMQLQAESAFKQASAVEKIAKAQALAKKGQGDDMKLLLSSLLDGLKLNVQREQMAQDAMLQQNQPQGGTGQ